MEGNQLTLLPEDFFQRLPLLKWLDLRNNQLMALPSAYIGSHKHLTHLLLQGNQLQSLPLELGEHVSWVRMVICDPGEPSDPTATQGLQCPQWYKTSMSSNLDMNPERVLQNLRDLGKSLGYLVVFYRTMQISIQLYTLCSLYFCRSSQYTGRSQLVW